MRTVVTVVALTLVVTAAFAAMETAPRMIMGAGPDSMMMVPMMMPMMMNRTAMSGMTMGGNVMMMVPMSVSRSMMDKMTADKSMMMCVMDISVPMMGAEAMQNMMSGRGPGTMPKMDKPMMERMMSEGKMMMMATMAPMMMNDDMMSRMMSGKMMMMDEAMMSRMAMREKPVMVMPMMADVSMMRAGTMCKPTAQEMMDTKDMVTVMVPVMISKSMMKQMMDAGSMKMNVPAMMPMSMEGMESK